jgi:hypothetical protein
MKILRVLGLALAIVLLRSLVPVAFGSMEQATISLFNMFNTAFLKAQEGINTIP